MQPTHGQRFYYPELDGLRFIAFLLVFIHNSSFLESSKIWKTLNEYGWVGVDLFFCLSAFLITKLLLTEYKETRDIDVHNFYIRRVLRIWPLYFTYIVIAIFYTIVRDEWNLGIARQTLGLITFTFNFVNIFLFPHISTVFIHLWTISYEEQFYAVIPWVLKKLTTSTAGALWKVVITSFFIGSIIRATFIYLKIKHPAIYMLPVTRFEAILFGIAIGLGLFDQLLRKIPGWVISFLGFLMTTNILFLPKVYNTGWSLMITYPLIGIGTSLVLFSVIRDESFTLSKALRNKAICYLGKISYGLYIFHIISNVIITQIFMKILKVNPEQYMDLHIITFTLGLLLTILLSILSYYWIEKPFLRWKEKFSSIKSRPI